MNWERQQQILGDFDARSNKWWIGDTQTSNKLILSQLLMALDK